MIWRFTNWNPVMNKTKRAFTLVEALLVITVLAVLAILLASVGGRQRENSRSVVCLAKLRHLGLVHRMWRVENNDHFAPNLSEAGLRPSRYLYRAGLISGPEEMRCPSAVTLEQQAWIERNPPANDAYTRAFLNQTISYGVNALAFYQANVVINNKRTQLPSFRVLLGRESGVPLFFDSKNWQLDSSFWGDGKQVNYFIFRHQQKANVVFLDGHAEPLDRAQVSKLTPLND